MGVAGRGHPYHLAGRRRDTPAGGEGAGAVDFDIPELEWREVQANKARNVTFFQADKCGRQDDTAAYFHVDADLGWYADGLRQANYWREATVCVKSQTGANVSAGFKEGVIAHEIGHTYGLGEAYIDNNRRTSNLCNDSVSSAMDGTMFALVISLQIGPVAVGEYLNAVGHPGP